MSHGHPFLKHLEVKTEYVKGNKYQNCKVVKQMKIQQQNVCKF